MLESIKKIFRPLYKKLQFSPPGIDPNFNRTFVQDTDSIATLRGWLPYCSYDELTQTFINRTSKGFILELSPLVGSNEQTTEILASIFTDMLPEGTNVQFLLIGSHKIGAQLSYFVQARRGGGEIFHWLAQKRSHYLQQGTLKSLFPHQQMLLRDFRLLLTVSLPDKHPDCSSGVMSQMQTRLQSSLKSIGLYSKPLAINAFITLMRQLTAPNKSAHVQHYNWQPLTILSSQLTNLSYEWIHHPESLRCTNHQGEDWEIICLNASQYPSSWASWQMVDSIGSLFNAALQIPCPFLLSFHLHINPRQGMERMALKSIDKEKDVHSTKAKIMPHLLREYQDLEWLKGRIAEGDRALESLFQIILYCPKEQVSQCERAVNDLYRSLGWKLEKPRHLQLPLWLSALPMVTSEGMFDDLKQIKLNKTITAFNAANLAPIQGEYKGGASPRLLFVGRRGQVSSFDVFASQQGNYNIAIAAKSGSGKSTLTQEIIVSLLGTGGRVWAIDAGRSYEKTCHLLNGKFLAFDPKESICINPFSHIRDFDNEALPLLKPLFAAMAHPNAIASDEELAWLEQAIRGAWQNKANQANVSDVVDWLKSHNHPICNQLVTLLFSYTASGMYGRYFEGQANINLDHPFVVLELQELKNKKDLQRVVLLVMMVHISQTMVTADRAQPKMCIIDEAWDLLNMDGAKEFIELLARTARKFKLSLVTITQSIADYYRSRAALAAFENSDHKIILAQTPETIAQLKDKQYLALDDYTEKVYKSLRKTDHYAECVIQGPDTFSIQRIILDPFARLLYSSKGEDVAAIQALQDKGVSLKEAIEYLVENQYGNYK